MLKKLQACSNVVLALARKRSTPPRYKKTPAQIFGNSRPAILRSLEPTAQPNYSLTYPKALDVARMSVLLLFLESR